jgi:hypothetical protein
VQRFKSGETHGCQGHRPGKSALNRSCSYSLGVTTHGIGTMPRKFLSLDCLRGRRMTMWLGSMKRQGSFWLEVPIT